MKAMIGWLSRQCWRWKSSALSRVSMPLCVDLRQNEHLMHRIATRTTLLPQIREDLRHGLVLVDANKIEARRSATCGSWFGCSAEQLASVDSLPLSAPRTIKESPSLECRNSTPTTRLARGPLPTTDWIRGSLRRCLGGAKETKTNNRALSTP